MSGLQLRPPISFLGLEGLLQKFGTSAAVAHEDLVLALLHNPLVPTFVPETGRQLLVHPDFDSLRLACFQPHLLEPL